MNDLALLAPETLPANLTVAEIDDTMAYAAAEKAPSTRVAYAADWKHFSIWCLARGAQSLPAHQGLVAAYLTSLAKAGKTASTIGRRAAAIADRHKRAGFDPPTNAEGVRATIRGIRRTIGTAKVKKTAATADIIVRMLAQCGEDLIGRRDRALIAVGMAGAFRRSELVALTTDDVETVKDGLLITIRRSKGDQEGGGQTVSLPHGHHIRPVEALEQWLAAAGIAGSGQVLFRSVALGGRLGRPLTGDAVAMITKKLVARAGLDPADFGAHSLRSGFLSSAAETNASIWKMQEQSRHRSMDVLSGYVRSKNRFVQHAGAAFL